MSDILCQRAGEPQGSEVKLKKEKIAARYLVIGLRSEEHKFLYPSLSLGIFKKLNFESYLLKVVPKLPKGSFFILDNAAINKNLSLSKFLYKFQCNLVYLPPYSPELNPIERTWGSLKTKLRNSLLSFSEDFLSALWRVLSLLLTQNGLIVYG